MTDFINGLRARCRLVTDKNVFSGRRHFFYCGAVVLTLIGVFFFCREEKPVQQTVKRAEAVIPQETFFTNGGKISRDGLKNPFVKNGGKGAAESRIKPAEKKTIQKRKLVLTGTASGAGGAQAIIQNGESTIILSVGEIKDGIRLIAVGEDGQSVTVSENNEEKELWLRR